MNIVQETSNAKEGGKLADISTKAINQLGSQVAGLLEKRLPKDKAETLAALISTGQFTHDFPNTTIVRELT